MTASNLTGKNAGPRRLRISAMANATTGMANMA